MKGFQRENGATGGEGGRQQGGEGFHITFLFFSHIAVPVLLLEIQFSSFSTNLQTEGCLVLFSSNEQTVPLLREQFFRSMATVFLSSAQ